MLKQLLIRNIAIIGQLELGFRDGLTVITGESGSGKSILLDAIALAFGAKASPRDVLRSGCERGQVELVFDIGELREHAAFRAFLAAQDVPLATDETEILLSREFTSSGSRSRVNGAPVTREILESLRPWIIDLHGQHELTSLFSRDRQCAYLDATGGAAVSTLKRELAEAYDAWNTLKQRLENIRNNHEQMTREREFMAFQLRELEEARLENPTEDEEARRELEILSHAEKLIRIASVGEGLLMEGDAQTPAVLDQLATLEKKLSDGAQFDPALEVLLNNLQGLISELRDVASDLRRYGGRVEADPERIGEMTDRLDLLEKLKRKYGPSLADAIARRDELNAALSGLEADAQDLDTLQAAVEKKAEILSQLCVELREVRESLAADLKIALMAQLQDLAMPSVCFDVSLLPTAPAREGSEDVEFLFSANPGEPLRPLAKVASGGELSRFLLAMKVLTAEGDNLLTLVFDEIDTGISGPTARAVAEKLAALSGRLQVFAITHQPMIAALGHQHLHVEKQVVQTPHGNETVAVSVSEVAGNPAARLEILSRMISGAESSDEAVATFVRRLQEQAEIIRRQHHPARIY